MDRATLREQEWRSARDALLELDLHSQNTPDPYGQLSARRELEAKISTFAVAPHEKLPKELLAEVFLTSCGYPNTTDLPPRTDNVLLRLTHVCAPWRGLALQLPELWANISLTLHPGVDIARLAAIGEEWLLRAQGNTPLSFNITARPLWAGAATFDEHQTALNHLIERVVLRNSPRVAKLILQLPIFCYPALFSLPGDAFPRLESLTLEPLVLISDMTAFAQAAAEHSIPAWQWPDSVTAFETAPLLREVEFNLDMTLGQRVEELLAVGLNALFAGDGAGAQTATSSFRADRVALPWAALRSISFAFTACPVNTWLIVLEQCPSLESCTIGLRRNLQDDSDDGRHRNVPLRALRFLFVVSYEASESGDLFLSQLLAPDLEHAAFQGLFTLQGLLEFQQHSKFSLSSLTILSRLEANAFARLLDQWDTVTVWSIPFLPTALIPVDVWDQLASGLLLPRLKELILTPGIEQIASIVSAIAQNWEASQNEDAKCASWEVNFIGIPQSNLEEIRQALEPLNKYAAGGKAVQIMQLPT